jgi:hypothetical protein
MSPAGEHSARSWRVIFVNTLLVFSSALSSCISSPASAQATESTSTPLPPDGSIPIILLDKEGKQFNQDAKVLVRVSNSSLVDDYDNGGLGIFPCDPNTQVILAWAEDYEVAVQDCNGQGSYTIQLKPLSADNNFSYVWLSTNTCGVCHLEEYNSSYNEFNQWSRSGHSNLENKFFETMYLGTNAYGISSPLTTRTIINNELVRNHPSGAGFKLDFPQEPGNCAYCHVPASVVSTQASPDLTNYFYGGGGAPGERITCEICHKVLNITLDKNDYPLTDRPGILSFVYLHSNNNQYFVGPFANINVQNKSLTHKLTCSQLFNRSEFCAACHYGKFGDMLIYNSYGEWKTSKYGDNPNESDYKTCQDCHMTTNRDPNAGLVPFPERDGCTENGVKFMDFNHNLMDYGLDTNLKREISRMVRGAAEFDKLDFTYEPEKMNSLGVTVRVVNTKAGHKIPTDSPLRHLILVVEAIDRLGTPLMQTDGERIPNWGGVGNPPYGMLSYGGKAGKIFANLLVENDTNISPTAAYWNPTKLAWINSEKNTTSDTRLAPDEKDTSKYYFSVPEHGDVTITIKLIYRYAFFDLALQKGWAYASRQDIVVTAVECKGPPTEPRKIDCIVTDP